MTQELSIDDLKTQIAELAIKHKPLKGDALFVLWFLLAYLTDKETEALGALCGVSNDKNVDAVLIDDAAQSIFIVQGKYRHVIGKHAEKRNDVLTFVDVGLADWRRECPARTTNQGDGCASCVPAETG